ncbi:MAG: hypothetical protein L3K11_05985, partial [Thermoplasmata archaeon]|nr:hypothetical protein [Thermoplasmata archaeon]
PGTLLLGATAHIPSNTDLQFCGTLLRRSMPQPALRCDPGTRNVHVGGRLTVDGGGLAERFFYVVGSTGFRYEAETVVQDMPPPQAFLLVRGSTQVELLGPFRSNDSAIVRSVDSSDIEVANVDCTYVRDPGEVPIGFWGSAAVSGLYLHDVRIDGGGFRRKPLIDFALSHDGPPAKSVRLERIHLENPPTTVDFHDGIDVDHCDGVEISDVSGQYLNLVLCLMASNVTVRRVRGSQCWGPALQVGDPTCLTEDIAHILVEDCEAVDSGRGYNGPAGSGMGVFAPPGRSVQDVIFRRCRSVDAHSVQPFGLGITRGASLIRAEQCEFTGRDGGIRNDAGPDALELVDSRCAS